ACGGGEEDEATSEEEAAEGEAEGEASEGEEGAEEGDGEDEAPADPDALELDVEVEELAPPEDAERRVAPEQRGIAHVLVRFRGAERAPASVRRSKEEAEARAREALERIEGGETLAAVAAEMSDDDANKDHGGDMGTLPHGLLPGPVDTALFEMEVDEVRGPIESPFGYHVIQRTR
ncbi:MAG TPA: peptidylprolyl isomerase, partial [Polyangiaceae bacterium LLY-WYZ-15_(1-7)]|nr:peptidylprolyl isomerase [Polyangiaceae bacterium LLY-WYZ-15_(1-7)]